MATIGFVGLGTMGLCMARNLIKNGHQVIGFDFSKTAMNAHTKNGGKLASSAAEAAQNANFAITMLPNGKATEEAVLGANGITDRLPKDRLIIDMSTIHP